MADSFLFQNCRRENGGNTRRGNLVSLIAVAHPVPALAGGGEVSPEDLSTLYAG